MTRNLNYRIEVACPIYNKELQEELRSIIDIQLNDNIKTRICDKRLTNKYKTKPLHNKVRAQTEIYNYLKDKAAQSEQSG